MKITSNHHKYDILYWEELTEKEQAEFDWIEDCDTLSTDEAEFVRYRGWVYCLNDIMRTDGMKELAGWDGYVSDSFFSGVVFRYPVEEWGEIDSEHIICGWYCS